MPKVKVNISRPTWNADDFNKRAEEYNNSIADLETKVNNLYGPEGTMERYQTLAKSASDENKEQREQLSEKIRNAHHDLAFEAEALEKSRRGFATEARSLKPSTKEEREEFKRRDAILKEMEKNLDAVSKQVAIHPLTRLGYWLEAQANKIRVSPVGSGFRAVAAACVACGKAIVNVMGKVGHAVAAGAKVTAKYTAKVAAVTLVFVAAVVIALPAAVLVAPAEAATIPYHKGVGYFESFKRTPNVNKENPDESMYDAKNRRKAVSDTIYGESRKGTKFVEKIGTTTKAAFKAAWQIGDKDKKESAPPTDSAPPTLRRR